MTKEKIPVHDHYSDYQICETIEKLRSQRDRLLMILKDIRDISNPGSNVRIWAQEGIKSVEEDK